ncbi:MAG: molecular chaperone TorD family protein, partial [Planctomycetes bacterium]|nr:molecular chaperone TorD family protein [Planctomycetota bacterium]
IDASLRELGLTLPGEDELEETAAEFFRRFLSPTDGFPLVQSLYEEGSYSGEACRSVAAVARAAGLEFDREDAHGAAADHLGCQLILWSRIVVRDDRAAAEFAQRHLAWAPPVLRRCADAPGTGGSFYASLASSTADFITLLLGSARDPARSPISGR